MITIYRSRIIMATLLALAAGIALAANKWSMQPTRSTLTFVGTQAGAKFEGRFKKFTADVRFDPRDLANARFDVTVDLNSVDTQDAERDDTLKSAELFNAAQYPEARYVADKFTSRGGAKFAANGKLTLRGVTRDVPIQFTFEPGADGAWLKGSTTIKRLDFGVGQGDWADTEQIANEVEVRFALLLKQ
jgi:polyisoprenoid-binding protein YceI